MAQNVKIKIHNQEDYLALEHLDKHWEKSNVGLLVKTDVTDKEF